MYESEFFADHHRLVLLTRLQVHESARSNQEAPQRAITARKGVQNPFGESAESKGSCPSGNYDAFKMSMIDKLA
jgi:hypothetical protein